MIAMVFQVDGLAAGACRRQTLHRPAFSFGDCPSTIRRFRDGDLVSLRCQGLGVTLRIRFTYHLEGHLNLRHTARSGRNIRSSNRPRSDYPWRISRRALKHVDRPPPVISEAVEKTIFFFCRMVDFGNQNRHHAAEWLNTKRKRRSKRARELSFI